VCAGFRTLILLSSFVISVDSLVIIVVDVLLIVMGLFLHLLELQLLLVVVRQLVDVVGIFIIRVASLAEVQVVLLSVNPALLITLSIHFFS